MCFCFGQVLCKRLNLQAGDVTLGAHFAVLSRVRFIFFPFVFACHSFCFSNITAFPSVTGMWALGRVPFSTIKVKVKVKLSPCLVKYRAVKAYGGVEVQLIFIRGRRYRRVVN